MRISGSLIAAALLVAVGCEGPPPPAVPESITVSPTSASFVSIDDTARFTAVVFDQYGEEMPDEPLTWTSSDPAVAMVDVHGTLTAKGNGTAAVEVSAGATAATAMVTVRQKPVRLEVAPEVVGMESIGDTARITGSAWDANGHPIQDAKLTWSSLEPEVATVDCEGLVTSVGNGHAAIRVLADTVAAEASVQVSQVPVEIEVDPSAGLFTALGDTLRIVAVARDGNGHETGLTDFGWSSEDAEVATVDETGLVKAVGNGFTEVKVEVDGLAESVPMGVAQAVTAVSVLPDADTVTMGDTTRLEAEATDANGYAVEGAVVEWSARDVSVAKVDGTGLVTGIGEGATAVAAVSEGVEGSAGITVVHPDRAVLETLFRALGGTGWTYNRGWMTDAPLRSWYGVGVDTLGSVRALYLSGNGLVGELPPEIGDLPSLEVLFLQGNRLSGPIPPEVGRLEKLRRLFLSSNQLTGRIPPELGDLASLEELYLSVNRFWGALPPELGRLGNLRIMIVTQVPLQGPLPPEFGDLGKLEWLYLERIGLTGSIPAELGRLASLEWINLGLNRLTGPIPPELCDDL